MAAIDDNTFFASCVPTGRKLIEQSVTAAGAEALALPAGVALAAISDADPRLAAIEAGMSATIEPVLRFDRFPNIRGRQRDTAGRLWQIVRIEMPFCWASRSAAEPVKQYRLEVVRPRSSTRYHLPLTTEQRPIYEKMRRCGVGRDEALAQSLHA